VLYKKNRKIKGYHGTDLNNRQGIVDNNYNESKSNEWLGDGVYFFIEKVQNEPVKDAENWAITEAWDNTKRKYKYNEYVVLESEIKINPDKLLDLDTEDGIKIFNEVRSTIEKSIVNENKKIKSSVKRTQIDNIIFTFLKKKSSIEFVKSKMYIKFENTRKYLIESRIPNVCILSVSNPKKNIQKKTINEVKKGVINDVDI